MKPLLLIAISILAVGCGGKDESTTETKPVEEKVVEVKPTEEAPLNPNLKYEIKGDSVTITDCDEGASGKLEIPSTIEGKPVTSIRGGAFVFCKSLRNITIPDSVTSIGDLCFAGCESLTSIAIPDSVTSIDNEAFARCTSLTSIIIPDSVTIIGNVAFRNCASLTSITIPDSVTSIGGSAFSNCSNLTSIKIPDSVASIGASAFSDCSKLNTVTFLGDAPKYNRYWEPFDKNTTIYRKPETKGWGDTWAGRPVKLISEKP